MNKKKILDIIEKDVLEKSQMEKEEERQDKEEKVTVSEGIIISEPVIELINIEDIKGVGTGTVKKLNDIGIYDIADLAIASAIEIHEKIASTQHPMDFCEHLVTYANEYLEEKGVLKNPLIRSDKLLENDLTRKRFSTGDEMLDKWLGGGIESRAVTELYGRFKSGKTQICDSVAVTTAASGQNVLFIDTENTYSPTRINEIAEYRKLDAKYVQEHIYALKPKTASLLFLFTKKLAHYIKENGIKLIIVDSIIALHRAEFIGRANLASRQQNLARMMSYLVKAAEYYNVGVIITNQVLDSPDPFKPGTFATGGNIISHGSTHRILLRGKPPTDKTGYRSFSTAIMEDSPRYARTELMVELGVGGVKGIDPSKSLKEQKDSD